MADSLRTLIRDTLQQMKDPLQTKQTILVSAEEWAFFNKNEKRQEIQAPSPTPVHPKEQKLQPALTQEPVAKLHAREKSMILTTSCQNLQAGSPGGCEDTRRSGGLSQCEAGERSGLAKDQFGKVAASQNSQNLTERGVADSPIRKLLQKAAPAIRIVEQVPDDAEAKRVATSWKERVHDAEVVLLLCDTSSEAVEFLKGLAKAIDQHLGKTKILAAERLEREKRWDIFLNQNAFRLIIASESMQKLPDLMRFYRKDSHQLFLDKTPLLLLSSAPIYKSLEHKAQLWKTLCLMLKK